MLSNTFNTRQFRDVSTQDQIDEGVTMLQDLNNPGDYYKETETGNVYLVERKRVITSYNNNFEDTIETKQHCVNPRNIDLGDNRSKGYMKLYNRMDRLSRIQFMSNKRANKKLFVTSSFDHTRQIKTRYIPV